MSFTSAVLVCQQGTRGVLALQIKKGAFSITGNWMLDAFVLQLKKSRHLFVQNFSKHAIVRNIAN